MAARIRKLLHDEETRSRIQTSQLVNRLTDHIFGKVQLEPTQVRAIEVLLRKTLPDLSAVEHSGNIDTNPDQMSDNELARIASDGSGRAAAKTNGAKVTH